MKLTNNQMKKIIDDKTISECSDNEREQVMSFAFGDYFMESNDKGKKKIYVTRDDSEDTTLLTDFQYWSDQVWFVRGTYPTQIEFNWFKSLSLNLRYKLIN
tara:strand:+ start:148 stop:450 length:303 start_codon:yes stop_codon:yes gene_type:complete